MHAKRRHMRKSYKKSSVRKTGTHVVGVAFLRDPKDADVLSGSGVEAQAKA
jgi:hypothetical protein